MTTDTVNIFLTRRSGGTAILWRNVPAATAKRLCNLPETAGDNFMMVWSASPTLGIRPLPPVVDDGRFDDLLSAEEKRVVEYWNGEEWERKE